MPSAAGQRFVSDFRIFVTAGITHRGHHRCTLLSVVVAKPLSCSIFRCFPAKVRRMRLFRQIRAAYVPVHVRTAPDAPDAPDDFASKNLSLLRDLFARLCLCLDIGVDMYLFSCQLLLQHVLILLSSRVQRPRAWSLTSSIASFNTPICVRSATTLRRVVQVLGSHHFRKNAPHNNLCRVLSSRSGSRS